jgi:hypothetical protein
MREGCQASAGLEDQAGLFWRCWGFWGRGTHWKLLNREGRHLGRLAKERL